MSRIDAYFATLLAALSAGAIGPAIADDNFARDRNESVRSREKPEYDAPGINAGGFRFYPELILAVEGNDNVLATDTNKESDVVGIVNPAAKLKSNWGTHALNFSLAAPSRFYAEHSKQNTTDAIASIDGRLDVDRSFNFSTFLRYALLHEPLANEPTSLDLKEPTEYRDATATIAFAKSFNRVKFSGGVGVAESDFEDNELNNGTPVEEDDRDYQTQTANVRVDYAVSPTTALFVSGGGNKRDYDLDPPASAVNRDSEGYEVLAGANFDLTRLMRGEIGVGYLSQTYDEPGVEDTTGVAVRAGVEWFPDELVTVNFGAARSVKDAGASGAVGYVANDVTIGLDYEYRRNVIFGFALGYSLDEYDNIDREDQRWTGGISVDYAINRGAAVFATLSHDEQTSDGLNFGREYDVNRGVIGVKLRR